MRVHNINNYAVPRRLSDFGFGGKYTPLNAKIDKFINVKQTDITAKKAFKVASILPKAVVTQAQINKIFSDKEFVKEMLKDSGWFIRWQKAIKKDKNLCTTGLCYPTSDFWYHFVDPNTRPMMIKYEKKLKNPKNGKMENVLHFFLKKDGYFKKVDAAKAEYIYNGSFIYDPTRTQYGKGIPAYRKAIGRDFLTVFPSKRACKIAVKLGIINNEFAQGIAKIFKQGNNLSFEERLELLKKL